ncbi:hypothetical protein I5F56_00405 [Pseudomonas aeruginosa]|nr:hypothetical protein [Pseudomonas aeruginosa]
MSDRISSGDRFNIQTKKSDGVLYVHCAALGLALTSFNGRWGVVTLSHLRHTLRIFEATKIDEVHA